MGGYGGIYRLASADGRGKGGSTSVKAIAGDWGSVLTATRLLARSVTGPPTPCRVPQATQQR
mgnify:CR=1 FL=1